MTEKSAYFVEKRKEVTKTKSGLQFVITSKGSGAKPKVGTQVFVNYAGYLIGDDEESLICFCEIRL